ncbi:plastid ribosomal protein S17 [Dunaliella salina]|uniref:Small ribosomal subunit protein uS17c n=1 Tax=Dunaliella salina TaxID=3046 RepID=A0ABQ7GN57_DUNSA|nr:plastid ribosomal protein S17 [Dunaliella salina]|eukprot:KAF5836017.1 plastid ribosomal protein S17 [Dunaliella salina]
MQGAVMQRSSAFAGSSLRPSGLGRQCGMSRAPVVSVHAVQDLKGYVVSTSNNKTAVVNVERLAPHSKYFKRIRTTKRYTVQDEENKGKLGDYVRLEGCRPLSKTKRFVLAEVLREAN